MTKVVNNDIYTGCLVPFFPSVEAEQHDARIMKIGWKLRELCKIESPYNIL